MRNNSENMNLQENAPKWNPLNNHPSQFQVTTATARRGMYPGSTPPSSCWPRMTGSSPRPHFLSLLSCRWDEQTTFASFFFLFLIIAWIDGIHLFYFSKVSGLFFMALGTVRFCEVNFWWDWGGRGFIILKGGIYLLITL